jgi:hypothetical protein
MKSTQATVRQRVEEVLELRLAGATLRNIRHYANAPDPQSGRVPWNVSDSQLWRYIRAADDLLAAEREEDRDKLLNRHIAQRRALFARCLAVNDYRAALACVEAEARLQGLHDTPAHPAKVELPKAPKDVVPLVASTVADLRAGRLDNKTATTIGGLAGTLLRSMEVTELEERLAALEAVEEERRASRNGRY